MSLVLRLRYDDWWGCPEQLTQPFVIISLTGLLVITLGNSFWIVQVLGGTEARYFASYRKGFRQPSIPGKMKTKTLYKISYHLARYAWSLFYFVVVLCRWKPFQHTGFALDTQNFILTRESKVIWQRQGWIIRSGDLWEEENRNCVFFFFSNFCYQLAFFLIFALWIWAGHLIQWFPSTLTHNRYIIL